MTGHDIIDAARVLIGTPFVHQGRIAGKALDCAGVVVAVASMLGIEHSDVQGYARIPTGLLKPALDSQSCIHEVSDFQAGDILLMRFKNEPQHLAIYSGETIIHAWQIIGKVCEHRFDTVWRNRVVTAYRFNEVANG